MGLGLRDRSLAGQRIGPRQEEIAARLYDDVVDRQTLQLELLPFRQNEQVRLSEHAARGRTRRETQPVDLEAHRLAPGLNLGAEALAQVHGQAVARQGQRTQVDAALDTDRPLAT